MQTYRDIMTETGTRDYTIERLSQDHLADLALLHAAVYKTVDKSYYPSKYQTSYTGVSYTGFIAYNTEGVPVAYYGVLPCFVRYGSAIMLAAQSADTMTHPQHRYKGMFVELSQMTFQLCRELGIRLIFGFPNQNSYHGAVTKLGWKELHTMDAFMIPTGSWPVESLARRWPPLNRLLVRYRMSLLRKKEIRQNGVRNPVLREGFAGVYRSEDYLKYKMYSPTSVIEAGGGKIWISTRGDLVIGDMDQVSEKNFSTVMKEIKELARKMGFRQIQFHSSPGTSLHRLFSSFTKPLPSFPVLVQDFGSPIPPEQLRFTFADIDIF